MATTRPVRHSIETKSIGVRCPHLRRSPFPIFLAAVLALASVGCADDDPLTLVEWEDRWVELANLVDVRASALTPNTCEESLVEMREARTELTPPPEESLRSPVTGWFDAAESLFFDCEADDETLDGLAILRSEVETVLEANE